MDATERSRQVACRPAAPPRVTSLFFLIFAGASHLQKLITSREFKGRWLALKTTRPKSGADEKGRPAPCSNDVTKKGPGQAENCKKVSRS